MKSGDLVWWGDPNQALGAAEYLVVARHGETCFLLSLDGAAAIEASAQDLTLLWRAP
jgi:hypothetical protein